METFGGVYLLGVSILVSITVGLQRTNIDRRVLGLSILVDHKPDREAEVVQALAGCSHRKFLSPIMNRILLTPKLYTITSNFNRFSLVKFFAIVLLLATNVS